MASFADRLIQQVLAKDSDVLWAWTRASRKCRRFFAEAGHMPAITAFHELVIDAVGDLVPAVKPGSWRSLNNTARSGHAGF